jgi:hypothetical protein
MRRFDPTIEPSLERQKAQMYVAGPQPRAECHRRPNPDDERSAEAKGKGNPRVLAVGFVFLWRTKSKTE